MSKDSHCQTGVIGEANSNALFITLNCAALESAQDQADVLQLISSLPHLLEDVRGKFSEAELHMVVALSSQLWDKLALTNKPAGLQPFQAINNDKVNMPATDADLLLHIRSERHDVNYHLAQLVYQRLTSYFSLAELVRAFRYLDQRDLTGFVDGTENPQGASREEVAVISNDTQFNGGSYIHLQKYLHDLTSWERYTLKEQEDSYGRTKQDNIEYAGQDKSSNAHTKRSSIKDANGKSIEILRHSLPFGELDKSGLMFASYAANAENFNLILASMCQLDTKKEADHILRVTNAVTGQAFFAPSLEWFEQHR